MYESPKRSTAVLVIFLFLLMVSPVLGFSKKQDVPVMPQGGMLGTTLYVGGAGPDNYSRIQDAINNATPGDTIFVYHGLYQENVCIDRAVTLQGENRDDTIIDGGKLGTVVDITASNVIIQGFTIQHSKSGISYAGIDISTASNVLITNNTLRDNEGLGVSIQGLGTTGTMIAANKILNNSYGIFLQEAPRTEVIGNTIVGNGEGAYLVGMRSSVIKNNVMSACTGLGLHLESSYGLTIDGNTFSDNKNGMYVFNTSGCNVTGNIVYRNRWYGIWLKDSSDNVIEHNNISSNVDLGVYLDTSDDNTILSNVIIDNDNGIYVRDSSGNVISNNHLRSDKYNANFVTHTLLHFHNTWRSNYWERPRIIPYLIMGSFKINTTPYALVAVDWTPLRHPPVFTFKAACPYRGAIWYVGGNGPNNFSSIQDAIDHAAANDTVYVFNGTYDEAFSVNKPLYIIGENKTATILDGDGIKDLVTIIADYVTISGFTIQNSHFDILINHSSYETISDNIILSGLHGVSVQNGCHSLTITRNSLQDNVYGVRLYSSTEVTVSLNAFHNFKENAFFYGTTIMQARNHWESNYWDTPRHLPYAVHGRIRPGSYSFLWVNFDWSPLQSSPV
ncbi:MAG TPA: NosD domain-containing protein [Candidatus Thermoplasmatota archaeon]|nr:NosD domain-containing protein [Candidatus Thermoplasmatota archaeon]